VKNVANLAIILAQVQSVVIAYDDACSILTTMLQHQQGIVDNLGNRLLAH
jgi:hypothetical protein